MHHVLRDIFFLLTLFFINSCATSESTKPQIGSPFNAKKLSDLSSLLDEVSGTEFYSGNLWLINDAGNKEFLHALDAETFTLKKSIKLLGAANVDWEALAQDEKYFYILDAGNTHSQRKLFKIYRIPKLSLDQALDQETVASQSIEFTYGDENGEELAKANEIDCEALVSINEELWLFSRGNNAKTTLYKLNKKNKRQMAVRVAEYKVNGIITAADFNPRLGKVALLGFMGDAYGSSFVWVASIKNAMLDWSSARHHTISPHAQWKALSWAENNSIWTTSENSPIGNPIIAQLIRNHSTKPPKTQ